MTYMENEKYKLVDGFGPYNNHRYEILEKDFYYDNTFEKKTTIILRFHSPDLTNIVRHFNKYYTNTKTKHRDLLVVE